MTPLLAQDTSAFSGGPFAFLGLFGIILAFCWLIFPFIVISKCNEILKLLRRIDKRGADDSALASQQLAQIHDALAETNKALQWMVDFSSRDQQQ